MACNYSNKFLPLVISIAESVEWNKDLLNAELAKLFENPDVAMQDAEGLITFTSEQEEQKSTETRAPKRLNTKQATIGVKSGSSISSAYLGRSDAYSEMIKNFRRKVLEFARIKIDFNTGDVQSFDSNSDSGNGVSTLNRNLFEYKLELIERILREFGKDEEFDQINQIINNAIAKKDWNTVDVCLNGLIDSIGMFESVPDSVYDAYVILSNFDKLLEQECPYIEVDARYGDSDTIHKYKYVGANVSHFTGWTSSEFANSMDQASMLVKAILDYVPETTENGVPIEGSSIGLSGFYSVMAAMRNTLLYHAEGELLQIRKELLKGSKVDMGKLIDAYIDYLQSESQNTGNVSSYYDTHKTYLIGKLQGIKDLIFGSNLDQELKDIFNNMFFKNVQMSYVAYSYDPMTEKFSGTDLKASAINQQTYGLLGTVASAIYNFRTNGNLFQKLVNTDKNLNPKYLITSKTNGYCTIKYKGAEFSFGPNEINTTFGLSEFKDIFFDLFGYILPDNYVEMGRQINGGDYDYKEDLGKVLRLGLQGVFDWGKLKYEETKNFPSNINSWLSEFAPVGKIISTIYGADTVNVIKNVSKKNNLPLFGLTSLAYNFPFIMWNHMDSTEDGNIYQDSFLFDKVDGDEVISRSIIGEPKIRSEVMCNGKLKSTSKLTVAEVAKLSILDDFFRNFTDKEVGHIYLQNATFADKGTHFLVNYNLDTPIYGEKTLRTLIAEQMKPKNPKNPNDTDLFRLMYNTRSARIMQLVENILNDYDTVFPDGTFNTLSDINAYIKRNKLSHDDVRKAFAEHNNKPNVRKVNFYEEIHLSKGKVNETIALYYEQFTDETKLAERLDSQRKAFVDDLKTNRVKFSINSDSISKQIGTSYKKTGYKDKDGNDIEWVMSDGTIRTHIEVDGKTILHPVLEGYFMANDLLSNEYNEVMIGGVYSHSKNTESSRLIAQIKRSVIYGATMHSFAQGLENGVADEVKIACMPDVQAYVQNLVGTEQTNDSMDGSGLCTMLQARLESNSLLDARVGYDKKSIGHDIDSQYGRPSLLKWAVYAMTNARRRIAYGSNISQETLCKKAYSAGTIDLTTEELNSILKQIGPVYFKDTEKTGKYFKIISIEVNPQTGMIERTLQEVTANGTEFNNIISDSIQLTNTLWDIDQIFGGAWAMKFENDTLEYSESNVDALEAYVIKHQDAKTKQIGYLVNKSAMKVGVGNLNTEESWTDDSKLNIITMRTRYIGVQMDAEHHLDENEVTEMTQMISALSENGYTSDIVNSIYTDIGNVIVEALSEYDAVINSNDPQKLYKKLGEIFIKSFENNDRDTLGLAQAFVLKATKALKENDSNFRLPFSAETVSGLFVSTVSSLLTKKGIRRKYEGFAGVLTPSYNMMQYYRVGGQTMMYERFADLVREKGIVSDPVTGRSAVARAINDIVIDGELNPFLVPISQDQVDFEDTIVIFDADESGKPIYNPDVKPIYIQSYTQYDEFKHADLSGKVILNFTSRPKNLKATNTKFKVDGKQYSVYELDSVRAMFNFKNTPVEPLVIVPTGETAAEALRIGGINTLRTDDEFHFGNPFSHKKYKGVQVVVPTVKDAAIAYEQWLKGEKYQKVEPERRQWIIDQIMNGSLYGKQFVYYTETVPDASYGVDEEGNPLKYKYDERPNHAHVLQKLVIEAQQRRIHKWIQKDLRSLNKGRGVMLNGHSVIGTDVQVTPAELITGRYHAKEFMMDSHENISDIVAKGEQYFVDKLTTKYGLTGEEPVWAETILFTETGERYLVRTVTENQRAELMRNGYPKDASIEEINGSFYSDENKITSLEGVSFHKYKDEKTGQVWKVILVDSEETKQKLNRSTFFDFYRNRYVDKQLNDQETIEWKQRINRRAKRMYDSFKEQRKMLGTRIPTQAMQSFMPMEIIWYTDSLVNDVYVPVQQFFLQGSKLNPQP